MKPIYRILISIAFAIILCYVSFFCFIKIISKYEIHNSSRLTEILENNTPHDVIFVGSSRTHFSINPKIIDTLCNINSYNVGIEGGDMYEFEMIINAYLEHHKSPKCIVLNFDMHSFNGDPKMYNYPVYFPYYRNNKTIKKYLKQNNYLNNFKEIFPFLQISDFDDNAKGYIIKGLLGKNEVLPGDFQYKGFISNTDVKISSENNSLANNNLEISSTKVKCFERIILSCKKNGIQLLFTYAPEFKKKYQNSVKNRAQIFSIIETASKQNNITFLREDNLEICNNPNLFANITHLNKSGAEVYTLDFAKRLNQYIN